MWGEEIIVSAVVDRIYSLAHYGAIQDGFTLQLPFSPRQAVAHDLVDPVRLFVKNELHSREKIAQRRMRLIMSISVIDQLVERALFTLQNKAEIASWEFIPSKPGLGLHDDGLQSLVCQLRQFSNPVETDVSGFDWSVKGWMLALDAHARVRLCSGGDGFGLWRRCVFARVAALSRSCFVLSDGKVFEQDVPGIQKSGSYNTSSTNSRMRCMLAFLAGASSVMAMGDDCVEEWADGAAQTYSDFGLRLKDYKRVDLENGIEFCGTLFGPSFRQCHPVRLSRLVATLLRKVPKDELHAHEMRAALAYELRYHPLLGLAMELVARSGWGPRKAH